MHFFCKISKSLLLWAASLVLFSCEEPNWDFDPYSDNLGPGYSAFGFYSEGVKYINAVFEESYYFSVSHEIQMYWNRCIEDGEAGLFMRIELSEKGEVCIWENNDGSFVSLGPFVWLYLPLEKIKLGEEITLENPNNAINLKLHTAGEENWYRNRKTTKPFKSFTVTFTKISKEQICGSFHAEIEVDILQDTTIELKNGVFFLREDQRGGTYKSWLEDGNRTVDW